MNRIHLNRFVRLLGVGLVTTFVASVQAQNVTNFFPNGDFAAGGPTADWLEVNGGGTFAYSYPTGGGNPNEYGVIDSTAGGGGWGIWVGGATDPGLPLSSLGLVPGSTYTFVQDMKTLAGTNTGGLKIESWGPSARISDSGDMRPATWSTTGWSTYAFNYTIAFGATAIKVVPLWGANSSVGFDNLGVVVPLSVPLNAQIINPNNGATVGTNFLIVANASVTPGSVTNVDFYRGASLLGSSTTAPFNWNVVGATPGAAALKAVAKDDNGGSVTSAVVNVTIQVATPVSAFVVDPAAVWQSYMTVRQTPQNFNAVAFAQPWGAVDLTAQFSGSGPASILTLKPAALNDTNTYWYDYSVEPLASNPTNFAAGAVAFKEMEASYYVQVPDGSVSGNVVKFSGNCKTNTLDVRLNPTHVNGIGNGWTNYAFVKEFAADYSTNAESLVILTSGVPFSVSLPTSPDPTLHVQYGFVTRGPNVYPSDTNNYGAVQIQSLDASPTNVTVNSSAAWVGFVNVFNKPQDGGGYQFGSGWGTADLCAVFTPAGLKLSPNTVGDPAAYWYTPAGGPGSVGNKSVDASMYVEIGALPGRKLIFSGTVLSNTLVSASNTNKLGNGWTSVAFIKDFAPDYSSSSITVPLTNGAFSIQLITVNDPLRHVQYGFETIGPNVWVTDVAPFGNVLIANVGILSPTITPSRNGGNLNLTFPTQAGKTYTVQYKNLLTTPTWSTLTTTNGTGVNAVVSDPVSGGQRYYRLSVQ